DGAELLLYHLPRDGYEIGGARPADERSLPRAWAGIREALVARAATPHVAVFIGADHHAAHPAPARLRELIAALEPDAEVRISSLDEFLIALEEGRPRARIVEGELRDSAGYTWTLQGAHGTRLPLKRRNARAELHLERFGEPLAALAVRAGGRDRRALLGAAWETLVAGHFHDTIAGCTSDLVAAESAARLDAVRATTGEIVVASVHELIGHDPDVARNAAAHEPALAVWNPRVSPSGGVVVADLTFFRRDILVGPPGMRRTGTGKGYRPFALVTPDGAPLPVQVIERRRALERIDAPRHYPDQDVVDAVRVAFEASSIPGHGLVPFRLAAPRALRDPANAVRISGQRVTNGLIEIGMDGDGALELLDVRSGVRLRRLLTLESERDHGDTYTFAPGPGRPRSARARVPVETVAAGPLVGILSARWEALEAVFRLRIELRAGEPLARLTLDITNRARDRRLRARLPLGLAGRPIVAGAAFGLERRHAVAGGSGSRHESVVATAPAQRVLAAADAVGGLAVLVPGHCEYEWTGEGDLLLTLLRSVGQLSRGDLPTRPGHAGWPVATPGAQCIGTDRIELALAPVADTDLEGDRLHRLWERAFLPPAARWIRNAVALRPASGSIELDGEGLVHSAVKPAESGEGIVLRCWNATEVPRPGRWLVTPPPRRAWLTRADEGVETPLRLAAGGTVEFTAPPAGIVTIRIE
ncbi:MAG TPA: glycoside hydrolase family 38 C-terminal domain-containing protein, partial [Gemmatimonadales bacterium]|nr:glycoside hydrolase family 38 C-terminal domain-containing protein [Gemmatimonadales bacterium]